VQRASIPTTVRLRRFISGRLNGVGRPCRTASSRSDSGRPALVSRTIGSSSGVERRQSGHCDDPPTLTLTRSKEPDPHTLSDNRWNRLERYRQTIRQNPTRLKPSRISRLNLDWDLADVVSLEISGPPGATPSEQPRRRRNRHGLPSGDARERRRDPVAPGPSGEPRRLVPTERGRAV
jgi:hypothetical protein